MENPQKNRMTTRAALEELVKSIRCSDHGAEDSLAPGKERRVQPVPRDGHRRSRTVQFGASVSNEGELERERERLDRRAVQLDRMEEILRKMLRAVERREDEIRERERRLARSGFDDDMKIEILRREQALREAEERLADRERFVKETEALLLEKAREIKGSHPGLATAESGN